jgi:hypothetical protein
MIRDWLHGVRNGKLNVKTEEITSEQDMRQKAIAMESARIKSCNDEVNAILAKYNCGIVAVTTIAGNQIVGSEARIVSKG